MEWQEKDYPELKVPKVLVFLAESILKLGGAKTEGIFRIPGDTFSVNGANLV